MRNDANGAIGLDTDEDVGRPAIDTGRSRIRHIRSGGVLARATEQRHADDEDAARAQEIATAQLAHDLLAVVRSRAGLGGTTRREARVSSRVPPPDGNRMQTAALRNAAECPSRCIRSNPSTSR